MDTFEFNIKTKISQVFTRTPWYGGQIRGVRYRFVPNQILLVANENDLLLVLGGTWLQLTGNTIAFIKSYFSLTEDCLKLYTPELLHTIDETLYDVFKAQVKYVENSLLNETQHDVIRVLAVKYIDACIWCWCICFSRGSWW